MTILESINRNHDVLKTLSGGEQEQLAAEIRERLVAVVSRTGGHLSSNLGIVELTIALHTVFTVPPDRVIWDVGHQCYVHKLLTGRDDRFPTLRQSGGLSGFPNPAESPADVFQTGHAGTAVSSATGLKIGQEFAGESGKVIAVIGDGSLTNGATFEGLNYLGHARRNVLVVLNDNQMSISPTKGALSYYLTRLITSPILSKPREDFREAMKRIPSVGAEIARLAEDVERRAKYLIVPGVFFEKMGLRYLGPIDGHDLEQMAEILRRLKDIREPALLHVVTKKGKGYRPAETNPAAFHSAGTFNVETGVFAAGAGRLPGACAGALLEEAAARDPKLAVITAAMERGLGLEGFASRFPERFFDVGIAESHSVILASGLARAGMRVVVAIYSTFLQRTYDELVHDICLQNLPVVFLVDRAGIVGDDGPTHQGFLDVSFLRTLPRMRVFAPYSLENLGAVLAECLAGDAPAAVRYPRAALPDSLDAVGTVPEKAEVVLLGAGSCAPAAGRAAELLRERGIVAAYRAIDRIKPLPEPLLREAAAVDFLVTVEENSIVGGFGSAVTEWLGDNGIRRRVLRIGLPDLFIEQGPRALLLAKYGLSPEGIADRVCSALRTPK